MCASPLTVAIVNCLQGFPSELESVMQTDQHCGSPWVPIALCMAELVSSTTLSSPPAPPPCQFPLAECHQGHLDIHPTYVHKRQKAGGGALKVLKPSNRMCENKATAQLHAYFLK